MIITGAFKKEIEKSPAENAIAAIRALRKGVTLGKKLTLKKLIEEGRK